MRVVLAAFAPPHPSATLQPNSIPKTTLITGVAGKKHLLGLRYNRKKEAKRELNKEKTEDGESSKRLDGAGRTFQATGR